MNRILKCFAVAATALLLTACVDAASEQPDLATVKAAAQKKFEHRNVESVRATPIKGVYEVVMKPRQIVYADASMSYMFVGGDLVDIDKRVSLTEARMQELMHTDFATLPFDKAIKIVHGDGTRKVAIFSDPDCPFCKKLERDTLKSMQNVTMYVFLFPLTDLHPDASHKASLIWCSDNRAAAWQTWIYEGKLPTNDGKCETPIASIATLAQDLQVRATPTMVFENGDITAGAIDTGDFETKLVAKKKS
ncbi:MAG: DsbC family protein [Burkholderiales bacterium]|nr:DsbC family protein [Burkholderiales bacterium]